MECYEGATMIKTFRGLMADDTQDAIVLHTNDGSMGYRITRVQLFATDPDENVDSMFKIYKVPQTTQTNTADFNDQTLLCAGNYSSSLSSHYYPEDQTIFFDKEIFNQDIYLTLKGTDYTASLNYYIELEQVKLDLNENTVATLKDIRNKPTV